MTAEDLAVIHAAAFEGGEVWDAPTLAGLLDRPGTHLLTVAEGFALVQVLPPEAELLTIAVAPKAQGRGQGRKLLAQVIDRVRAEGCDRLFLEVSELNAAALGLYKAAGFAEMGRRKGYYAGPEGTPQDALVLSCSLTA